MLSKLSPPARRRSVVDRERLSRVVDEIDGTRVVFVSAPAGYGKTTLLLEWFHRLRDAGWATAWITLDRHDDDPERVVSLLASAFVEASESERAAVFVDELEALAGGGAQGALRDWIARLPEGRTLVVAGRAIPDIGLARLRLRGELREVRAEDLRFDLAETALLLQSHRDVALGDDALRALHGQTDGWVAAIRLTALALEGRRDADAFVGRLSGDLATIAEYLAENVLAQQPEELRTFLLETSVLDRLTGPLCDAVTGRAGGFQTLDRLERSHLFLQPLDEQRKWYRYHPLFAEFLRDQLARAAPERVRQLHHVAAHWLAENGGGVEAIEHAFQGNDRELAARLLDDGAMASVRLGRNSAVLRWAERLGEPILSAHPRIRVAAAWAHVFLRDVKSARAALEAIRSKRGLPAADRDEMLTIEAAAALSDGRILEAMEIARENLEKVSSDGTFAHGALANIVGFGLMATSRFAEARDHLVAGRASHARAGSGFGEGYSIGLLGLLEALQGRLGSAISAYREAERLDDGRSGASYPRAVVAGLAAEVLYERNELAEAERWLEHALLLGDDFSWLGATGFAPLVLARIRFARGAIDEAQRLLDTAEGEAVRRRFAQATLAVRWERVRFALRRRDDGLARELASALPRSNGADPRGAFHYLTETEARDVGALRLRVRSGDARGAIGELGTSIAEAARLGRVWRWIKLSVVEAEAYEAAGERALAVRSLRSALRRGAPERFLRSFADEGEALVPLLLAVRSEIADGDDPIPVGAVDAILSAVGLGADGVPSADPGAAALEPLSEREIEVLTLTAHGLSNRRLARRLYISENTVKTHLKHIFAKLGVRNRTAALFAARRLRLIP